MVLAAAAAIPGAAFADKVSTHGDTGKDKTNCETWPASLEVLPTRSQIRLREAQIKKR